MNEPPFRTGDLLCLQGSGVVHGRHCFEAEHDAQYVDAQWRYGMRPWGCDDGADLRHATPEDVLHELKIEVRDQGRTQRRIESLASMLTMLKKQNEEPAGIV